jgi:hypothetical protein
MKAGIKIPTAMLLSLVHTTRYVDMGLERIGFQLFNHINTQARIGRPMDRSAYSFCAAGFNRAVSGF